MAKDTRNIHDKKKAIEESPVGSKTIVVEVRDFRYALALHAVGVPFADPKKPMSVFEFADGTRKESWRFAATSSDGKLNTQKLVKAFKNPQEWLASNREHLFAYTLLTAINFEAFQRTSDIRRPLVGFNLPGGKTIYVFKDSRKHVRLKAMKGAVQI